MDSLVRDHSTGDCMCADGFEEDKDGTCVDIDECELDPCKDNEVWNFLKSLVTWFFILIKGIGYLTNG